MNEIDYNDLWAYDPATDTWEQKASLPAPPRYAGVAFSIDGIGYYGTGAGNAIYYNDFHAYDPVTDTWMQKADFPGNARRWAVGFAVDGRGYIGTGESSGVRYRDFHAYDPLTDTWQQRADLGSTNRRNGYAFMVDGHAYAGGGQDFTQNWNDFHRYDVGADSWLPVSAFPLNACKNGASFSTGNAAFIVGGNGQLPVLDEIWRFLPDITTGSIEHRFNTHLLFPNPVNDRLWIKAPEKARYVIHDPRGAIVAAGQVGTSIDMDRLPEGLYTLIVEGGEERSVERFMIAR